jgi:hypothetical protein
MVLRQSLAIRLLRVVTLTITPVLWDGWKPRTTARTVARKCTVKMSIESCSKKFWHFKLESDCAYNLTSNFLGKGNDVIFIKNPFLWLIEATLELAGLNLHFSGKAHRKITEINGSVPLDC